MSCRQVILPSVFNSLQFRAFEILERWMLAKVKLWKVTDGKTDLESHVELNSAEVADEICEIWLLMFRSKEALNTALCVLEDSYEGGVLAEFCRYYAQVLKDTEIEVKR
jgi:hypothetical protein